LLAQHNIAVYSPHTAVDAVEGGLNDFLAEIITEDESYVFGECEKKVIRPIAGSETTGYGRLATLGNPTKLSILIDTFKRELGNLSYAMVARPRHVDMDTPMRTVAVCAGSGGDIISESGADLLVTGEMSHHVALKAVMRGQTVLTFHHSNSERAFLKARMQPALLKELRNAGCHNPSVEVSKEDRDPFEVII
jgi:putative NIF3 family GTP cyclohydrolase 1 type 2